MPRCAAPIGGTCAWFRGCCAAIGVGGLLTGARGDWWTTPSWASLALGLGLLAASVVQRVRRRRERSDLPEG